jgi:ketosteroid isomerase-like protein
MPGAFAENMVRTIIGSIPVSSAYKVLREIQEKLFPKLIASFECMPKLMIDLLIAEDDYVVVLIHGERGISKNDTDYNKTYCHVLKLIEGKFVEFLEYCDIDLIIKAELGRF